MVNKPAILVSHTDVRVVILALLCVGAAVGSAQAPLKKPVPPPAVPAAAPPENWPVWGGLRRNFIASSTGLADAWPAGGPRRVWTRALGDGYSAVAAEHGVLYTGYRRGSQDVVVALDAATGKTLWEYAYDAPFKSDYAETVGPGPYAMPQVVGNRVLTASATGRIHSIDKRTGRPAWSHDLYAEQDATRLPFGYSCHGLPYKDTVIYLAGGSATYFGFGRGSAAVAYRQGDGSVAWKNLAFRNAHSSPILITVDGEAQVAALVSDRVIGFSPDTGELLWSHPHATQHGLAIATPVWAEGNVLFVSSAYSGGARALKLAKSGGKTTVTELWHNPRIQLHFGSAIKVDDHIYVSSAHSGPAFMSAVELKTGKIAWQTRDFAKAQLLHADGKLIVLDEDGVLGLARATPHRFEVLSRAAVQKRVSWTPPTLVGTRLFIRDRSSISAFDLGR